MDYTYIAEKIGESIITYKVTDESFYEVFEKLLNIYGNFDSVAKGNIMNKLIHFISANGYDIDCIKPLRFKKYLD